MGAKAASGKLPRMALLVHSDTEVFSKLQAGLEEKGFITIVARDLRSALSAMTEHHFEVAIVASRLSEGVDGWPLAGVLHLVFPYALVCVVSPTEPDVLMLQAAINYGVREVYRQSSPAAEVINSILRQLDQGSTPTAKSPVN
jgi:DNA-binding NtrC family response regulator